MIGTVKLLHRIFQLFFKTNGNTLEVRQSSYSHFTDEKLTHFGTFPISHN